MQLEFDPDKRDKTLAERGLDFARAEEIFSGVTVTIEDARQSYGEARMTTVGTLDGHSNVLVWTPRGEARRIISMRKANERAADALEAMGLSISNAIRLLMLRIADEHRLPFEVKVPSKSSRKALAEIAAGKVKTFATVDDLMADLNADD